MYSLLMGYLIVNIINRSINSVQSSWRSHPSWVNMYPYIAVTSSTELMCDFSNYLKCENILYTKYMVADNPSLFIYFISLTSVAQVSHSFSRRLPALGLKSYCSHST